MNSIFSKLVATGAPQISRRCGQSVSFRLHIFLSWFLLPGVALADLNTLDECAYTDVDPSVHIVYTSSRMMASFQASVTINGETTNKSGSYELRWTPITTIEITNGIVTQGLKDLASVRYGCGWYSGYYPNDEPVPMGEALRLKMWSTNADLPDDYPGLFLSFAGANVGGTSTLTVSESHSGSSYYGTVTATAQNNNGDSGSVTITVQGELDGALAKTKDANDGRDRNTNCGCSHGMPTYSVSEPFINLWVKDTPLFYNTSLGKSIEFETFYKQRGMPPTTNTTMLVRGGWSHNWFSYVHFSIPAYFHSQTNGGHPIGTSPRGVTIYSDWVMTNDYSHWSAILYAPDGGENYFGGGSQQDGSSGLQLMPIDGVNDHIIPDGGGPNVYGRVGFRVVHPDGSQDIYGQLSSPLKQTWGPATNAGRIYDSHIRPPDTAAYRANWSVGGASINTDTQVPGGPIYFLSGDAYLTERIDPYGNSIHLSYTTVGDFARLGAITDYDKQVTTFGYNVDGTLSQVQMPGGEIRPFHLHRCGGCSGPNQHAGEFH